MRESTIRLIQYVLGLVIAVAIAFHLQLFTSFIGPGYVTALTWEMVAGRMKSVFYDTVYTVLLFAALGHGLIGLRNIVYEMTESTLKRRIATTVLILVFVIAFILGMVPIVAS